MTLMLGECDAEAVGVGRAVLLASFVLASIIGIVIVFPGWELGVESQTWRAIAMCIVLGSVIALIVWAVLHRDD
jgi:hypothetical protein